MAIISESKLWKKRLGDWVINPYVGCEHGCKHCYCPAMPGVKFTNGGRTQREWGQRVQFSVFECIVDPAQWVALRNQLLKEIDPKKDSLRFYFMGSNWKHRVEHHGIKTSFDQEGPLIV